MRVDLATPARNFREKSGVTRESEKMSFTDMAGFPLLNLAHFGVFDRFFWVARLVCLSLHGERSLLCMVVYHEMLSNRSDFSSSISSRCVEQRVMFAAFINRAPCESGGVGIALQIDTFPPKSL